MQKKRKSGSIPKVKESASLKNAKYSAEEHALGLELQRVIPTTVAHVLVAGCRLAQAFDKLSRKGRASMYRDFCRDYLPSMDQKTLDRWRVTFEAFKNLITVSDEMGTDCPYLVNLRLTALYALSKHGVSEEQRRAAIAVAQSGTVVTQQLALSLTSGAPTSRPEGEQMHHKVVRLPAGRVSIRVNHEDFRTALEEAVHELDTENGQTSHSSAPGDV